MICFNELSGTLFVPFASAFYGSKHQLTNYWRRTRREAFAAR
jgi:hypothetical protein